MSYSVVVTYQTPSGNKTVGTNSSRVNSVTSNLQNQGYKIIKIEAQGAGKNVVKPVKAAVPSAQQNKETTTIYEAGTPIGKELESPAAPTPMQTLTAPSIPQQGYSIKSEPTPQGQLITETIPMRDSSVKAIPETQQSIQNRQDAALAKTGLVGQTVVAGKKALGPVMNIPDYLYSLKVVPSPTGGIAIGYTDKSLKEVTTNVQAKGDVLWSNLVNKNYVGATTDVLLGSSTMTDIVLPVATGGAFKYISLGAKAATVGGLSEKAYKYFVRPTQAAIQYGVVPATLGTEIGMTAAQNPKALGTFGAKTSLQFIMMGVGYNYAKPSTDPFVKFNVTKYKDTGTITAQKYVDAGIAKVPVSRMKVLTPISGKYTRMNIDQFPNLRQSTSGGIDYLKPIEPGKVLTPSTGKYIKPSIDQFPNLKRTISNNIEFLKPINQGKILTPISGKYTRMNIDQFPNLRQSTSGGIDYLKPIEPGKVLTPSTGKRIQIRKMEFPQEKFISSTSLSTKVWPKMMRFEETLPWSNYLESGSSLFEGKSIVTLKPRSYAPIYKPKQFNFKDIIKETKMPEGGQMSGGRLKTITIQEQKIKVETKSLQVTKPLTEKQYLETMLQQKLEYKTYREPTPRIKLSFEEPTYIYASLSSQQQTQQPKMTFQSPFKSTTTNQIQRNIQTQIQNITQNQNQIQLPRYDVSKISLQGISQIQVQGTSQKQTYSQTRIQNQIQEQMQEQMQGVIQIPELRQTQETKQEQRRIFELPSISTTKEEQESLKGYNVFIKERHYFKGKKKKPTTWFKASKHPLTKEQAMALGATAVDRSAAAAFKIVPTEGEPKKLGFGVDSWGNLSGSFYTKGNTFIEKTPYRINTSGEIKGISALGWLSQRQRPYQSPTKIRYTPTANAKPMAVPKPISININKIMKGWKL